VWTEQDQLISNGSFSRGFRSFDLGGVTGYSVLCFGVRVVFVRQWRQKGVDICNRYKFWLFLYFRDTRTNKPTSTSSILWIHLFRQRSVDRAYRFGSV